MLALSLDAAKQIAVALVIGFVVLGVISAITIKNITTKLITVVLLGGFALGVWTQRTELQDCAARVRAAAGATPTTCTFFGAEIDVPGTGA